MRRRGPRSRGEDGDRDLLFPRLGSSANDQGTWGRLIDHAQLKPAECLPVAESAAVSLLPGGNPKASLGKLD